MTSKPQPIPLDSKVKHEVRLSGLGEWAQREYRLRDGETSIGSGANNNLVIDHTTVSRKHAVIGNQDRRYTITDLNSTNGTFLNGRRIKGTVTINPGDEIGFGAARFAMLGGTDLLRTVRRRRSPGRMFAPIAGIAIFALLGFIATWYVVAKKTAGHAMERPESVATSAPRAPASSASIAAETDTENSSTPVAPEEADVEAPAPVWLKQLNDFRAAVNLAPVVSSEKLTDGDQKHATYLLNNYADEIHAGILGPEIHAEDSSNSFYTAEGEAAARASDIAEQSAPAGGKLPNPLDWAIEGWMVAPFHRLPMLSPLLREVGFGYQCEDRMCVALLNVLTGTDPLPPLGVPLEHPILFPSDGASIPSRMRSLDVEWPNPLSGCNGFTYPSGLPMSVQLGMMVDAQLNSFSITRADGSEVEACGLDANSYYSSTDVERTSAINNLRQHGAVIIVPRHPLDRGERYDVVATVNGHDYKWSFSVTR